MRREAGQQPDREEGHEGVWSRVVRSGPAVRHRGSSWYWSMGLKARGKALIRLWRARLRKTDLAALRLYTKLVPSESQRIFLLTVLIGAVCGLAAVAFHLSIRFAEARLTDRIKESNFSVYPVVANGRTFLGFVTESRLRRLLAEDRAGTPIETIAVKAPQIFADQKLIKAAVKMNELTIRHLPVVDRSPAKPLVGLLAMSDLVKAQARVAVENGNLEHTQTPELNDVEEVLNEKFSGI